MQKETKCEIFGHVSLEGRYCHYQLPLLLPIATAIARLVIYIGNKKKAESHSTSEKFLLPYTGGSGCRRREEEDAEGDSYNYVLVVALKKQMLVS